MIQTFASSQAPSAPVETSINPHPDASKGKEVKAPQGKSKDKGKGRASDTTISQPEQAADPGAPKS